MLTSWISPWDKPEASVTINTIIYKQSLQNTMENFDQILDASSAEKSTLRYAGFWIRVGAALIDGLILGAVNGVLSILLVRAEIAGFVGISVLNVAYFTLMESSEHQATLGKMAVGIKVGDENGNRLTFANALGRYFAKILSAMILYIGFLMVAWDQKCQGLHDKLAQTYVFYKD